MTSLIVDIGNIEIPQGYRKDSAVYRPAKQGERLVYGGTTWVAEQDSTAPRIVLIPEPKPYVWPEWCKAWGWTMNKYGMMCLHREEAVVDMAREAWLSSAFMSLAYAESWTTIPIPTRDHFQDWKTPILNPHWKGE